MGLMFQSQSVQVKQHHIGIEKELFSQNVMLACDFDLNFVYVSAGWEGSASDTDVLHFAIRSGLSHRATGTCGDS